MKQINKRQTREPDTIEKLLGGGLSEAPKPKVVQSFPVTVEDMSHQENLKNLLPDAKDHTDLDNGINMEDKSKIPVGDRTCIFLQTSINDQRPKLRVHTNNIVTEGLLDMNAEVNIFSPESRHQN